MQAFIANNPDATIMILDSPEGDGGIRIQITDHKDNTSVMFTLDRRQVLMLNKRCSDHIKHTQHVHPN